MGGARAVPRGVSAMSMAGGLTSGMGGSLAGAGGKIDPAPLFKAAQAGDIRTLAQLALKMVESANTKLAELNDQVETLQKENDALREDNAALSGGQPSAEPEAA